MQRQSLPSLAGKEPTGSSYSAAGRQSADWCVAVRFSKQSLLLGLRRLTITGCGYLLRLCDVDLGLGLSLTIRGLATGTP